MAVVTGIPNPGKVLARFGPLPIQDFQRVIDVKLVGARPGLIGLTLSIDAGARLNNV